MLRIFAAVLVAVLLFPPRAGAVQVGDDGLFSQPWFHQSFFILAEDIADAAAQGKRVAVLFEQKGCPYCREMHRVNFAQPEVSEYIKANFVVIQFDMWGSRKVTDLDGKEFGERELARRWRVNFTPTIVFLPTPEEIKAGETEAARLPGYFKPFHFVSMFEYVKQEAYKKEPFQRFLQHKFEALEKAGKKPTLW